MNNIILYTILVMAGLGTVAAVILYFVAERFKVYEDPRIEPVQEALPPRIPFDSSFESKPKTSTVPKEKGKNQLLHTVQEGESLWKISRKYKVSVERLMEVNQLGSEKIQPGRVLKIPQ